VMMITSNPCVMMIDSNPCMIMIKWNLIVMMIKSNPCMCNNYDHLKPLYDNEVKPIYDDDQVKPLFDEITIWISTRGCAHKRNTLWWETEGHDIICLQVTIFILVKRHLYFWKKHQARLGIHKCTTRSCLHWSFWIRKSK
jgi:hypothetical protein